MTPIDLDAIRARDAELWRERDVPRDISVLDAIDAERDRHALLAEVDRLREAASSDGIRQALCRIGATDLDSLLWSSSAERDGRFGSLADVIANELGMP
jgi:predicted dinucleotide-utilizing enzyme